MSGQEYKLDIDLESPPELSQDALATWQALLGSMVIINS
jgi:hypothetical protein